MKNDVYTKSILAVATNTRKSENQDSKGEFEGENFSTIFIADGIGSFKYPRLAGERVTAYLKDQVSMFNSSDSNENAPPFQDIFKNAKQNLIAFCNDYIKDEKERTQENLFGTTAITLFETRSKISFAYVGNGAIWHIRGNFNEFPAPYYFPWNAVNYLNPHTIPENGKEALYRLISNGPDLVECIPSIIDFEKDSILGEVVMICTDGIYSSDQVKSGRNDQGVWVKYESRMLKFFEHLSKFFKTHELYNKENVNEMLNQYLEELKPTLEDDATIGILITKDALNYQHKTNWLGKDENNSDKQV